MYALRNVPTNSNKSLRLLSWVLGLLFILKSLDFFLSIDLATDLELSPVIVEAVLYSISGVVMILLAIGTIRLARWVRVPLYLVFVSNLLFIFYNSLLVSNSLDASVRVIGGVVLFFYLKKSRGLVTGRRLIGLQILVILTLLPITIFILLSIVFTDQKLLNDSTMRLATVKSIDNSDNLYITLTDLGDDLSSALETAEKLVSRYPSNWDQITANQIMLQLQPHIDAYVSGTNQAYQCPTSVNNFAMDAELCELDLLRDYAQVMQFAALYEAIQGKSALAQTYATAPITVGLTMLESDNVTLIEYFVGLASVNIGLDTLETLKGENTLSQTAIKQQLAGITIPTDSLRTPIQREYLGMKLALEDKLDLSQNYFYHPNRTRNELYTFMSQVAESSVIPCSADNSFSAMDADLNDYFDRVRSNAFNPTRPNMIGKMYLSVVIASFGGVRNEVCEVNERINALAN